MRRPGRLTLLLASCVPLAPLGTISAQTTAPLFRAPRSADYLFVAMDRDARMLWVNPAALGTAFQASITGEAVVTRGPDDEYSLGQWGGGFASRGFAFAYRRDRFDSTSGNTWRLGFGRGFTRFAIGVAATLYPDSVDQREVDLGIRYLLLRSLELGAVIRHIGEPTVRGMQLPVTWVAGLAWTPFGPRLQLAGEAAAADRIAESGYDLRYRAGFRLTLGRKVPAGVLAAFDLRDDLGLDRLLVGFHLGGPDHGVAVVDLARRGGTTFVDAVSVTGIATRSLRSR